MAAAFENWPMGLDFFPTNLYFGLSFYHFSFLILIAKWLLRLLKGEGMDSFLTNSSN